MRRVAGGLLAASLALASAGTLLAAEKLSVAYSSVSANFTRWIRERG